MFRVVPGTLLSVRHRVTEGSLCWHQKQGVAPGDLSPATLARPRLRSALWDFSEIKSRDLTFPVSFLATSLDIAYMPFVVV